MAEEREGEEEEINVQSLSEVSQWFRFTSNRQMNVFIQPCPSTFGGRVLFISTYQKIRAVASPGREAQRVLYRGDRKEMETRNGADGGSLKGRSGG